MPDQTLQPLAAGATYFDYMLGAERLALDPSELTRAFHAASLRVHPDRFAGAGPETQRLSVQHAEFLSQAYQTLRDPWRRAEYVRKLHGAPASGAALPAELAEELFEVQELVEDAPDEAGMARLRQLKTHLAHRERELDAELVAAFQAYDAGDREPAIAAMGRLLDERRYASRMREALA